MKDAFFNQQTHWYFEKTRKGHSVNVLNSDAELDIIRSNWVCV